MIARRRVETVPTSPTNSGALHLPRGQRHGAAAAHASRQRELQQPPGSKRSHAARPAAEMFSRCSSVRRAFTAWWAATPGRQARRCRRRFDSRSWGDGIPFAASEPARRREAGVSKAMHALVLLLSAAPPPARRGSRRHRAALAAGRRVVDRAAARGEQRAPARLSAPAASVKHTAASCS